MGKQIVSPRTPWELLSRVVLTARVGLSETQLGSSSSILEGSCSVTVHYSPKK